MANIDTEYDPITRWDAIRDYIINHDDCIPAEVIRYMDGKEKEKPRIKASLATVQKILKDMEREGTTIVTIDKKNRQIHHLHINDNYTFIYRELIEIEKIMNSMDTPIQKIRKLWPVDNEPQDKEALQKSMEDRNENLTNCDDLHDHFIYPYQEGILMMFRILFVRITKCYRYREKDRLALHKIISDLTTRLTKQMFNIQRKRNIWNTQFWI